MVEQTQKSKIPAKRDLAPRDKYQKYLENLENKDLYERVKILGEAYAAGAKAFEEDPKAAEEMKKLNTLIFIAAQEEHGRTGSRKSVVDYRKGVSVDEQELSAVRQMYVQGRAWSLDYFETIYQRLGTAFDAYYFESQVGEYGMTLVKKHLTDGIFEESDAAVVYRGEKKGMHTRVFVNSLGLPTYEAKELGLAPVKYADWPYDLSLIVTGNEINEYFRVVMAALTEINPDLAKKSRHIGHGMVRGPDGSKLSSRQGNILTGDSLIDEVKSRIYDFLHKSDRKYTKRHQEQIAEKAAVAAVKYSLLRVALPSDIAFDIGKSISFEGDSGPYIQYTYARARSVMRKAMEAGISNDVLRITDDENSHNTKYEPHNAFSFNPEEREVARLILYFPDIAMDAAESFAPNRVANYLFQLAQAFNLFYAKHQILGDRNIVLSSTEVKRNQNHNTKYETHNTISFRLALTNATAHVLKNGLYLLGIDVLEEM